MSVTSSETRQRSWWRSNQQWLTPWLFLTPGMIMFALYVVWPIFESFRISFYDWDGLGEAQWLGWANYQELFSDRAFKTSLKNNVIWLVLYMLADPDLVTYGIIAAGLWPQIAYCMILYLTGLNNVAPDQIEAARLDGAKGFKMLWYVILPQLRPATFIAVVVTVIGALRSFDLVSIMTNGGPFGSSRVLSYYMYEQALSEYGYRMGYGAAIAVILFLIMMVFISGFIWKMVRDERGVN